MFDSYTNKFKDFTVSSDKTVNEVILEELENGSNVFPLERVLLNDIIMLLEKSILNKLSSDIQFQKNYWTWGFVTIYYSNFYLAQILNRLSNKFFVYIDDSINREIIYKNDTYEFGQNNGDNTHQREFKLLKSNYSRIKTFGDSKLAQTISRCKSIDKDNLFKHTIDNEIKESEIRNRINYQLKHYKEIHLTEDELANHAQLFESIINNNTSGEYPDYFQLLIINEKRFLFLSIFLDEIKAINPAFNLKITSLSKKIDQKYNTIFHNANENTKALIKELLKWNMKTL